MKTDRLESLQIGHSHTKDEDLERKCVDACREEHIVLE